MTYYEIWQLEKYGNITTVTEHEDDYIERNIFDEQRIELMEIVPS